MGRFVLVLLYVHLLRSTLAQSLSDSVIDQIRSNLATSAKQSWEVGARVEALLELDYPSVSVFSSNPIPPNSTPQWPSLSVLSPVISIAQSFLQNGAIPLLDANGSSGDPASLGISYLIAQWSDPSAASFKTAADLLLTNLLTVAKRAPNGAISQRTAEVQLWSDFMYMVPPFLAYYGAFENNKTIIDQAYTQCSLYRQILKDDTNLWKHVQLGDNATQDPGHWATGNAWAAAGMVRVLATIQRSSFASDMTTEQSDLVQWIGEIHDAAYRFQQASGLLLNYIDQPASFEDAASTALLASTVYRISLLASVNTHIPDAEKSRTAFVNDSHIDSSGWVTPVVNPLNWSAPGSMSPESEAFALIMEAAWRDWFNTTEKHVSGAGRFASQEAWSLWVLGFSIVLGLCFVGL